MLTKEENDLLTQTGPGTPMGDLFRPFWLPALLSEEIPGADCPPVGVKLLGENLVAFRDSEGNPGLIDAYRPHRGVPLFFGRNEDCGLRCVYHGWKFDVNGVCVDLPNSPEGGTYKEKVRIKAYPAFDGGGIIWAYLVPDDQRPPHSQFEWLDFGEDRRYVRKYHVRCNYMQAMEGDFDPSHVAFLHSTLDGNASDPGNRIRGKHDTTRGTVFKFQSKLMVEDPPFGTTSAGANFADGGSKSMAVTNFVMPCFSPSGIAGPGVFSGNYRVPIDDENVHHYRLRWSYEPFAPQQAHEDRYGGFTFPEPIPGTFMTKDNKDNDYMVDRVAQKNFSFTGIKCFPVQDQAVVENQWGTIMKRDLEHLVSADVPVIRVRRRLMKAATELMEGQDPEALHNPAFFGVHTARAIIPADVPFEEAVEQLKKRCWGPPRQD